MTSCTSKFPTGELIDGRLRPCPKRPNCVSSEEGSVNMIQPIKFTTNPEDSWREVQKFIKEMGGRIISREPTYLWATFTSKVLRFVDDLELRLVEEKNLIHIRSSSRTGYYDFGVNRKRIEKIRYLFFRTVTEDPN